MYTKDNSELATFGVGIVVGMGLLAVILMATKLTPLEMTIKAQKEADLLEAQYIMLWIPME